MKKTKPLCPSSLQLPRQFSFCAGIWWPGSWGDLIQAALVTVSVGVLRPCSVEKTLQDNSPSQPLAFTIFPSLIWLFILYFYFRVYVSDIYICKHLWHSVHVEVRGQFLFLFSPLPLHGFWGLNSEHQVCAAGTFPPSHLASPSFVHFLIMVLILCFSVTLGFSEFQIGKYFFFKCSFLTTSYMVYITIYITMVFWEMLHL